MLMFLFFNESNEKKVCFEGKTSRKEPEIH